MRKIFLLTIIVSNSIYSYSQGVCDLTNGIEKGGFTFDSPAAGCHPFTARIKDNSGGGTEIKYIFDYQGEPASQLASLSSTTNLSHTFTNFGNEPVTYSILQYGKKNGKNMYYCNTVTVLANTQPVFTTSACNDLLNIIIPQDLANQFDSYQIDWGDGFIESIPKGTALPIKKFRNYSFPAAARNIKVEGFFDLPNNCPRATSKSVSMTGGSNYPNITKLEMSQDSKSATITFTGATDEYDIYTRSATGSYINGQFMMKAKPGTYKLSLIDTVQTCFKLFRTFGCREGSGEVCTTKLDIGVSDKNNIIKWQNHPSGGTTITYDVQVVVGSITTSIKREEKGGQTSIINAPGNPHTDPVDCTKDYCYRVENKVRGTIDYNRFSYESISISPLKCISRKELIPDAITESVVTINDNNHVEIAINDISPWVLKKERYIIYKYIGGTYQKLDSTTTIKPMIDKNIDASTQSFCYKIGFVDECKSVSSLSPPLCTVHLKYNQVGDLVWTQESPFGKDNIKNFEVQGFNEITGVAFTETTKQATENTHDPQLENYEDEAKYRIKIISEKGKVSYSNTFTIPIKASIFIPEAFTPDNNDNLNPELKIFGSLKRITEFSMKIFNRWGNPVFSSDNPQTYWDGSNQGVQLPMGAYSYSLYAKFKDGQEIKKFGRIELLK